MKRRHTTPRYYARNAAMQAQRRFLRTGKTEAERLDDHREATANVLVLCILAAIYDKYGIGEMRLQRVVDCANEISAKYTRRGRWPVRRGSWRPPMRHNRGRSRKPRRCWGRSGKLKNPG